MILQKNILFKMISFFKIKLDELKFFEKLEKLIYQIKKSYKKNLEKISFIGITKKNNTNHCL